MQFRAHVTRGHTAGLPLAAGVARRPAVASPREGSPWRRPGAPSRSRTAPPIKHVFVVNLENKGYDETFGPDSPAPYLSQTLRGRGQLLTQYYGTAHNSLPNYIAQISGQGPDSQTQADCQTYSDFVQAGTVAPQQAVGNGCVYPANVKTVADQLEAKGLTWRGYMEDMGTPCRHPAANAVDDTQQAEVGDQYAARHNPFVYFHSITDRASCAANDVDLSQLTHDLATTATTATSPTSRRTSATTPTTARASTAGPAGWPPPTRGCGRGSRRSWPRRRSRRTACWSSPSTRPTPAPRAAPTRAAARAPDRTRRCPASTGPAAAAPARCSSRPS